MRFLGYSEEHVTCVLAMVPEKERRRRKAFEAEAAVAFCSDIKHVSSTFPAG